MDLNNLSKPDRIKIGTTDRNLKEASDHLQDVFFSRGGQLVHLENVHDLETEDGVQRFGGSLIRPTSPTYAYTKAAELPWYKATKDGPMYRHDPPRTLGQDLCARSDLFRPLKAILNTPTINIETGELLTGNGYKEGSWLEVEGEWPEIGSTKEDAEKALPVLMKPFSMMPYAGRVDRAVAASMLLCSLIRTQMRTRPAHAIRAPMPGSGKTAHAETAGIIAQGYPPAHMAQGWNSEELEKRLTSVLLAGDPIVSVDNVERVIEGDFLTSLLTSSVVQCRILGTSNISRLPNQSLILFTGNGLILGSDMFRRTAICNLDPGCERPDQKSFPWSPQQVAKEHRKEIVMAGLTVLRAYILSGQPKNSGFKSLGSFGDWDVVRGALLWLGEADPADSTKTMEAYDPKREAFAQIAELWPKRSRSVREVLNSIPRVGEDDDSPLHTLWEAIQVFCDQHDPSTVTIGRALNAKAGAHVGDKVLKTAFNRNKTKVFRFEEIEREPKMV